MLAADLLGLPLPRTDKRLLTVVETDGCFADGISAASGCWVGHRTLRVVDYGKVAATFVDTADGRAVRIAPHPQAREHAPHEAPDARSGWERYLLGYQRMPIERLLIWGLVELVDDVDAILSHPDARATCAICGEEIVNKREVVRDGRVLCLACAKGGYYHGRVDSAPSPASGDNVVPGRSLLHG